MYHLAWLLPLFLRISFSKEGRTGGETKESPQGSMEPGEEEMGDLGVLEWWLKKFKGSLLVSW